MENVVGLFGRRRDAMIAWIHLCRHGFHWRTLRVRPADRYLQERMHPTISHLRSIHEYVCVSGGGMLGASSGMLIGLLGVGTTDPGSAFLLAAAGVALGAAAGYGLGRYDPMMLPLAPPYVEAAYRGNGTILLCVAVPPTRAGDAQRVLRRARAIEVFTCARE